MRTLLVLAIVAALVLGYGYYHARTHGWLYIELIDASATPYAGNIRDAEIRLLDGDGKLLADAKSDHRFAVARLVHPEVGDCSAEERSPTASSAAGDPWQKCFETLSTWSIQWAGRVRFADVKFAGCDFKAVPVTLQESREEWWVWWVPLPHIGGKPLTYFSLSISVDGSKCAEAGAPTKSNYKQLRK